MIKKIGKEDVIERIPPKVKELKSEFYYCGNCDKVYWKGSHYDKMLLFVDKFKSLMSDLLKS